MKNLAVIIPVYNHLSYTQACIEALEEMAENASLTTIALSIIVVDDGSTDGTRDWLLAHHPEVTVLSGDGSLWWSGGVNLGARYAVEEMKADYLLLWNNDITTGSDYLAELDKLVAGLPGHVIAGSKIYRKEKEKVIWSYGGIFNSRTGSKYMLGFDQEDGPEFMEPRSVDWLPGMGTLIPARVIGTIGYWNEKDFPQYHGDSDFTYRARLAGFDIIVYPQLRIWNDTGNTGLRHQGRISVLIRLMSDIKSNYNLRKNLRFYRKYATSILAYSALIRSYAMLFGGFFKWKVLALFGIHKTR